MKIIPGILILTLVFSVTCKNSRNDSFYERTLRDAQKNQKFVLLDFTAEWCRGCKAYDKYVFQDSSIVHNLSEKFILCKIDRDNPENSFLIYKYKISGLPHIVIIDTNEQIQGSIEGFDSKFVDNPDLFLSNLKIIKNSQ